MFERNALSSNARTTKIQYSNYVLKVIASVMLLVGTFGVAILQNGIMDLGNYSSKTLLAAFEDMRGDVFGLATIIILCSGIAAFALPIFSYTLVEGYKRTSSLKKYVVRVLLLALISEVPYDLAMRDSWFTMYSQNPVWGVLIALLMLYFLNSFEKVKQFKGLLLRLVIIVAALLWVIMLNVSYGAGMVMVTAVLWILEGQGALTVCVGVIASLIYFPAPFGFFFNHFCTGDKGKGNRKLFYVLYPIQLLVLGLIGRYLL